MRNNIIDPTRLERLLGHVLHYGTWLSCIVIALGVALLMLNGNMATGPGVLAAGQPIIITGITLLILLPALRVGLMLVVFLQERDYRYVLIAAFVLMVMLLGFLLGLYGTP